jgi:nucleotide-binding universal stress UspA family protein
VTGTAEKPDPRRILVALDSAERSASALEEAARLAAGMEAELVGLFIEDSELLAAAALPVTRLLSGHEGRPGALDSALVQRAYRIWSAELRKNLEAVAARWQVRCSFQVTRGALAEQLLSQTGERDLLAVETDRRLRRSRGAVAAQHVAEHARCSVLLMRRRAYGRRPVAVLFEGAEPALAVGRSVARIYHADLAVLALGEQAVAAESRDPLRAILEGESPHARLERLTDPTAEGVAEALRRIAPGVVVVQRRGAFAAAIKSALEQLDCSVLMVG